MNIQSNASGVSVETVALVAALQLETLTKRQLRILEGVFDILQSPSMAPLQRVNELRRYLGAIQGVVEFVMPMQTVPLDPVPSVVERLLDEHSSSTSTIDADDIIGWVKLCKKLHVTMIAKAS
jgi:hypothetical protein